MKVSELIEKLKHLPPDAVVSVTDSSCCGCDSAPISEIELSKDHLRVFLDGDRYAPGGSYAQSDT